MQLHVLKSKIHRAIVTEADINYVGSVTVDEDLMDAANLVENEKVQVLNINNGERLETYVIKAERGSGVVGMNGPAAKKASVGDIILILSYATVDAEEAKNHKPVVVFPDEKNQVLETKAIINGH